MVCACSLGWNKIGHGGAVALGKALEVNSSLHTLQCVVLESKCAWLWLGRLCGVDA